MKTATRLGGRFFLRTLCAACHSLCTANAVRPKWLRERANSSKHGHFQVKNAENARQC
jgi:hypothetical protein